MFENGLEVVQRSTISHKTYVNILSTILGNVFWYIVNMSAVTFVLSFCFQAAEKRSMIKAFWSFCFLLHIYKFTFFFYLSMTVFKCAIQTKQIPFSRKIPSQLQIYQLADILCNCTLVYDMLLLVHFVFHHTKTVFSVFLNMMREWYFNLLLAFHDKNCLLSSL